MKMPSPPSRSFFDHLCSPFFSAFRILGFCPYTRGLNGVFRKKIASASAAYTLCSGVAFGYGTVTAAKALFLRPPPVPVTDFNRALLSFAGAAFLAPSLIVPAVMWFETDKLQAYLQEWQRFQTDYDRIIGNPDGAVTEYAEKRVNRIFRLIVAFLSATAIALAWTLTATDNMNLFVCAMKNISTMAFITGFWYVSSTVFEIIAENYKKKLQTDADRGPVHGHAVEDYRLLWIRMSRLVHEAGDRVPATITFCIFYTSAAVVSTAYAMAACGATLVGHGRYDALACVAAVFLCNGAALYVYCDRGYTQSRKCIDGMIPLILKMKSTMTWQNSNCIQITLFLNAVNQYQPDVNVVGFYEINRGLFGSILSLLVTYLIVLIQLNSSFNTPSIEYSFNTTRE